MFGGLLDSFKPGVPKFVITGVVDTRTPHPHILGQKCLVNIVFNAYLGRKRRQHHF